MKRPKVTVLMGVYNGEVYLQEAIDSILSQTFKDFEFLIIDDGSTDQSFEIIQSYTDPRIRVVKNLKNMKLIFTLNRGLGLAKGEYIARMDADDISLPTRLEKQVAFMKKNSNVGVCGTWTKIFVRNPWLVQASSFVNNSEKIKAELLFSNVLQHPSVMIRRSLIGSRLVVLRYPFNYPHAEDYALWASLLDQTDFGIVEEVLLKYRLHTGQIGQKHSSVQKKSVESVHRHLLARLGVKFNSRDLDFHEKICSYLSDMPTELIERSEKWLLKLMEANRKSGCFDPQSFREVLRDKWFAVCNSGLSNGRWTWKKYFDSSLSNHHKMPTFSKSVFFAESHFFPYARVFYKRLRNSKKLKRFLLG